MIKKITILLYILLIGILGGATVVEAMRGTEFVEKQIYHAIFFCALWGGLSALSVILMIKFALWKRFAAFLLHFSFLTILLGALTTYIYGEKGYIHLRNGIETRTFTLTDSKEDITLPFAVQLDSFKIDYYPGTKAPKDYISYLTYTMPDDAKGKQTTISMNNIWICEGYRFYQTSFDNDSKGSFLTVNHDPWGTGITYAGYLLLAISMLAVLLSPKGTFIQLLRSQLHKSAHNKGNMPSAKILALLPFFALSGVGSFSASTAQAATLSSLPALKRTQADSLARLQVIYNDRVTPMNTLARDFVLKIYGSDRYKGLTPEQVIGGWILYPERWKQEPVIYVKDAQLRQLLGATSTYISLIDLYDGETYRLQAHYGKGNQKLDKAIWEIDEKVGLISMLLQGTLIKPANMDPSVQPLTAFHINAEMLYNNIPFSKLLFMFNLTVGLLGLAYLLQMYLREERIGKYDRTFKMGISVLLGLSTIVHTFSYALHWYIAGHIPLGNGYETMLFMALVILIVACLFHRKYVVFGPFGLLLSGFALLVAYLGQNNPQITPLMPVLLSPWLSSHVSLIMMSYALFAFIMLNGVLSLCLLRVLHKKKDPNCRQAVQLEQLTVLSQIMLYPATFFLGIGIFLGAVWANESWGRYWAWDPKEVWALITFMVYGAAFHLQSLPQFRKPRFYHTYMVLAFLTVLMTYFGVNYILGGMHSYA